MNAKQFLSALEDADYAYIQQAGAAGGHFAPAENKRTTRVLARVLLAAAVVIALAATVFAGGGALGIWNDRWLQTPGPDPVEVVREALSRQDEKEYTISVVVEKLLLDEKEAQRFFDHDRRSVSSVFSGWGAKNPALEGKKREDVAAVYARYKVQYDHTKTFYTDGMLYQYFYLVRNGSAWEIVETSAEQSMAFVPSGPGSGPDAAEDHEGALRLAERIVSGWGKDYRVESLTFDEARTEAAIQALQNYALAEGNGWTEDFLRRNLAAVTAVYTHGEGANGKASEGGSETWYFLCDPGDVEWRIDESAELHLTEGAWQSSEIYAFACTWEAFGE